MSQIWVVNNLNLYQILCPHRLKEYGNRKSLSFVRDEIIYGENTKDENVYMVSKGKVKIVNYDPEGNEILKQILQRGELFGEQLILDQSLRSEYAIACHNDTQVCAINVSDMKLLMRNNERFETRIYKLIGLKLQKFERRLELIVGKGAKERISSFIYDLYVESGQDEIQNELSHKDIGKLLGATREYVTKTFNELKQEGIIDYSRKKIIIRNPDRLSVIANKYKV
jgi:CRP-like cAMP-binding protein